MIFLQFFAVMFGALTTHVLCLRFSLSPVRAASGTAMFSCLMLALLPLTGADYELLCATLYGGCFLGMTDPERVSYGILALCSVLFMLLFSYALPLLPGYGGALGLSAFISVFTLLGSVKVTQSRLFSRRARR